MLTLIMMNDNDIPSKFKATIRILFVFGRIVKPPIRYIPSLIVTLKYAHFVCASFKLYKL